MSRLVGLGVFMAHCAQPALAQERSARQGLNPLFPLPLPLFASARGRGGLFGWKRKPAALAGLMRLALPALAALACMAWAAPAPDPPERNEIALIGVPRAGVPSARRERAHTSRRDVRLNLACSVA